MFLHRETEATSLASGGVRWLKFSNNRGRGRSRDQAIWIFFFFAFLKFNLLYHLSFLEDVFNNGFWRMCIKDK